MEFDAPISFDEAVKFVAAKKLLPTSLDSKALRALEGDLKRRSVFSARVTQADILTDLQTQVEALASGAEIGSSFTRSKELLLKAIRSTGYAPSEDDAGGIKDLTSNARLDLMIRTNVLDTQGYGSFVAGNDPVALDVNPALELVRFGNPRAPREWNERWKAAVQATTQDGATDGSDRLIALKGHPVWQALGDGAGGYEDTLGNPWTPFAFGSTMGTLAVSRDECEELGLLAEDAINPGEETPGLNESLSADGSRFSPALLAALGANPDLAVVDGVLGVR